MVKRQTIGENPLDGLFQSKENANSSFEAEKCYPSQKKSNSSKKQRVTVQISEDVIDRVKNAVYWTPGLTLASLAESAFLLVVSQLEKERGEPFQKRREELKTGRPIK